MRVWSVLSLAVLVGGTRASTCSTWSMQCVQSSENCTSPGVAHEVIFGNATSVHTLQLCDIGLECDTDSVTDTDAYTCVANGEPTYPSDVSTLKAKHGQSCKTDDDCGGDFLLTCAPSTRPGESTARSVCRLDNTAGVAQYSWCLFDEECASGRCEGSGVCGRNLTAAARGERCGVDEDCAEHLYCRGDGVCASPLPAGSDDGLSGDSFLQCPMDQICVIYRNATDPSKCNCTQVLTLDEDVFRIPLPMENSIGGLEALLCKTAAVLLLSTPSGDNTSQTWYQCLTDAELALEGKDCPSTLPEHFQCVCTTQGKEVMMASSKVLRFTAPHGLNVLDAITTYYRALLTCNPVGQGPRSVDELRKISCMATYIGGLTKYCELEAHSSDTAMMSDAVTKAMGADNPCEINGLSHQALGLGNTVEDKQVTCLHAEPICGFTTALNVNACTGKGSSPGKDDGPAFPVWAIAAVSVVGAFVVGGAAWAWQRRSSSSEESLLQQEGGYAHF